MSQDLGRDFFIRFIFQANARPGKCTYQKIHPTVDALMGARIDHSLRSLGHSSSQFGQDRIPRHPPGVLGSNRYSGLSGWQGCSGFQYVLRILFQLHAVIAFSMETQSLSTREFMSTSYAPIQTAFNGHHHAGEE